MYVEWKARLKSIQEEIPKASSNGYSGVRYKRGRIHVAPALTLL